MAKKKRTKTTGLFEDLIEELADRVFTQFTEGRGLGLGTEFTPHHTPPPSPLTEQENELLREVILLGFKEAAKQNHPDRGGDAEKMARINALRDKVCKMGGVKK